MRVAIIVHGGAGPSRSDEAPASAEEGCRRAARIGHELLRRGGSALEAVEAAVAALEDDPQFNAGTGSCLNVDGDIEMDASVMDGEALRAGAVALVRGVRNPVRLARAVMEQSPHLFLAGPRAVQLAKDLGLELMDEAALATPRARARWAEAKAARDAAHPSGGTVGAVALDAAGHTASATSTGGMSMKWAGRIGDSPLIGAGTYADDAGGAASATGHGEAIIRVCLTRVVVDALRAGASAQQAALHGIQEVERVRGEAGVITVDRHGRVGAAFNSERMSRAFIDAEGVEGAGFHRG